MPSFLVSSDEASVPLCFHVRSLYQAGSPLQISHRTAFMPPDHLAGAASLCDFQRCAASRNHTSWQRTSHRVAPRNQRFRAPSLLLPSRRHAERSEASLLDFFLVAAGFNPPSFSSRCHSERAQATTTGRRPATRNLSSFAVSSRSEPRPVRAQRTMFSESRDLSSRPSRSPDFRCSSSYAAAS